MKLRIFAKCVLSLALVIAVGCGGDDEEVGSSSGGGSTTPTSGSGTNSSGNGPSSNAATGTATNTATESPNGIASDGCDQCNLQGCCSRHDGIAFCSGGGAGVVCNDGTTSPSCRC